MHAVTIPKVDGRRARAKKTHGAIVGALLDLADEGNVAPTAQELATRAGVALRSIRQHFASREILLIAAGAEHARRVVVRVGHVDPHAPLRTRLESFAIGRGRMLEATAALRHAAVLVETKSPAVSKGTAELARMRRREVEEIFARELAAHDRLEKKRILDMIDLVSSGKVWDAMRRDLKLSEDDGVTMMRRLLRASLKSV
jgi:TetR/AcrR family transcriptional regulator of autoinduction and epiphytic fitness